MAGVLAVAILLGVGCINGLVNPVMAQEGCISHPLPPDIVDKLVSAANIAISQSSAISCSPKENRSETIDGHALATLALLQHSLSETKEDVSVTKRELENAVASVSSLHSSLSSTENELATFKRTCDNGLTEIQSTLAVLRNELAELRNNSASVTSKSAKCKDGWFLFQNSCYLFSTGKATWQNGRQQCLSLGADYVKILSDDELTFIFSIVVDNTWIGLNDLQSEGYMQWSSDGSHHQINRAWWFAGQPDNAGNNEDCVHIWFINGRKLFNDHVCTNMFFYICEMKAEATD